MKTTISVTSQDEAKSILHHLYEADTSSTYQGHWNNKRSVHGSVITATYDNRAKTVHVQADALHTRAGLNEWLPEAYRG